jgi:hypothetical protein
MSPVGFEPTISRSDFDNDIHVRTVAGQEFWNTVFLAPLPVRLQRQEIVA